MIRMTLIATALAAFGAAAIPTAAKDVHSKGPAFRNPIYDLAVTGRTETSLTLSWTSPEDSDDPGVAALAYDLRYSTDDPGSYASPSDWYDAATQADGEPVPSIPGSPEPETMTFSGLSAVTYYYFGIKSTDDGVAWIEVSNIAFETTIPAPPLPTDDLVVSKLSQKEVTLKWPWPAAWPGSADPVSWCYVAYTTAGPITDDNFDAVFSNPLFPGKQVPTYYDPPGTEKTFKLTGLKLLTHYWIAIRAYNDSYTLNSPVSNNVQATTLDVDRSPPAAVNDLNILYSGPHTAGLTCTVPEDLGGGYVFRIELRMSTDGPITTNALFDAATPAGYRSTGADDAGMTAGFETTALDPEKPYWFSVRARDNSNPNNWSDVSNSNQSRPVTHDTVPPAPTTLWNLDFQRWATSVLLRWNSVGNDGMTYGTAAEYDLRYSTLPITEGNFYAAARDLTAQAPLPPYNQEQRTVTGLLQGTTYYFAIKTGDDATPTNWSAMSNVLAVSTVDGIAPAAITDLNVTSIDFGSVTLEWTASGDNDIVGQATRYVIKYFNVDPADDPFWWNHAWWIDPPPVSGPYGTHEVFPKDIYPGQGERLWFAIKAYDELDNESGLSNIPWKDKPGDTTPPTQITDLKGVERAEILGINSNTGAPVSRLGSKLTWTAPADVEGTTVSAVTRYDLRGSSTDPSAYASIQAWWDDPGNTYSIGWRDPDPVNPTAPQPPRNPDSAEGVTDWVGGAGTRFYAIRSIDAWGHESLISPPIQVDIIADTNPPESIVNLAATKTLSTSVTLAWKAPFDDSTPDGRAGWYQIYWFEGDDQSVWWAHAPMVSPPPPGHPGAIDSVTVAPLSPDTSYVFMIRSYDRFGNLSDFSTVVVRTHVADLVPPAAIDDLAVSFRQSTYLILAWTATGDDGHSGAATRYGIRWSAVDPGPAPSEGWWTGAAPVETLLPTPSVPDTLESVRIDGLTPGTLYHFAIRAMDDDENWSPIGIPLAAATEPRDVVPPAAIATLRAVNVTGMDITLAWEAEGEDGVGSERAVQRYEIRYSSRDPGSFESPESWWSHATPYAGEEVAPAMPGNLQTVTFRDLAPGHYFFALKSIDEAPNWSNLSNVASVETFPLGSQGNGKACSAAPLRSGSALWALLIALMPLLAAFSLKR